MAEHRSKLTHLQAQVLAYMQKFLELNDQLPPQKTIAEAFGWASPTAALDQLKALEKKRYLVRNEVGHVMLADRSAVVPGDAAHGQLQLLEQQHRTLQAAATYALEVMNGNRGKQARLRAIQRLQEAIGSKGGAA